MSKRVIKIHKEEYAIPEEVSACRGRLAQLLDSPGVSFRDELNGRGISFMLTGPRKRFAEASGHQYIVLPFLQPNGPWYWLGVSLSYVLQLGILSLYSVSLVLFRGLSESEKEAFLRAEWDNFPTPGPHAQPHWHVYRSPATDLLTSEDDALRYLHLAMAARWHREDAGEEPHQCDLTSQAVAIWIDGCLRYIRDELLYIRQRTHG